MLVDLHMHSTCSDGKRTPEELVHDAIAGGLSVMALTDHDICTGYARALAEAAKLPHAPRIIPGVELSTEVIDEKDKHTVHVLGYYLDVNNVPLNVRMQENREARLVRLKKMIAKLDALGYHIDIDLDDPNIGSAGRPLLARALIAAGYFKANDEVFQALLKRGAPAYEPQPKMLPEEAVELIHNAGGIAILAHPNEIESDAIAEELLTRVPFDGVEVYHPSVRLCNGSLEHWRALAVAKGILVSGGSDTHGAGRYPETLGIWAVNANNVADFLGANK